LAGVKALTLHDIHSVSMLDLSTQFYFSESDIGKNRAQVTLPQIAELNPYTKVLVNTTPLESNLSILDDCKVCC